jgi:hypothetical protein
MGTGLLLLITAASGVKIGGGPKRVDEVALSATSLTELNDVVVLDTGLVIAADICAVPSAASQLATLGAELKEVRGRLSIEKSTCVVDLSFLSNLAVVRGDMVDSNSSAITLIGFAVSDLPASLMVRSYACFTPFPPTQKKR